MRAREELIELILKMTEEQLDMVIARLAEIEKALEEEEASA